MKVNPSIVISVEGYPFAGKTTVLRKLFAEIKDLQVIFEDDYKNFDAFLGNPNTLEGSITAQEWHFNRQIFRYEQVADKIKSGFPKIIIERGYFSEIAYSMAYSYLMKFNFYEYVLTKTEYLKRTGKYIKPDTVIIFNSNFDIVLERKNSRIYDDPKLVLPEFWFTKAFYHDYMHGLNDYIKNYESNIKMFNINGDNNLIDNCEQMRDILLKI